MEIHSSPGSVLCPHTHELRAQDRKPAGCGVSSWTLKLIGVHKNVLLQGLEERQESQSKRKNQWQKKAEGNTDQVVGEA